MESAQRLEIGGYRAVKIHGPFGLAYFLGGVFGGGGVQPVTDGTDLGLNIAFRLKPKKGGIKNVRVSRGPIKYDAKNNPTSLRRWGSLLRCKSQELIIGNSSWGR